MIFQRWIYAFLGFVLLDPKMTKFSLVNKRFGFSSPKSSRKKCLSIFPKSASNFLNKHGSGKWDHSPKGQEFEGSALQTEAHVLRYNVEKGVSFPTLQKSEAKIGSSIFHSSQQLNVHRKWQKMPTTLMSNDTVNGEYKNVVSIRPTLGILMAANTCYCTLFVHINESEHKVSLIGTEETLFQCKPTQKNTPFFLSNVCQLLVFSFMLVRNFMADCTSLLFPICLQNICSVVKL